MRCDAASGELQQEIIPKRSRSGAQDELEEVWAGEAAHGDSVRHSPTLIRPTPTSLPAHAVEALHIPSPIQRKNAWQHAEADRNNERIHLGFGRSLKRAWTSLPSFNLSDLESIRPRAGGKLGKSFRSLSNLYSNRTDCPGLECKEQIGEGTCGIVFRALYNGRQVAVKTSKRVEQYEEQRTCPVDAKTSFAREIEALQQCVHPNIVALITTERTVNGNPIMILEWLKCTLEEHFERNKGFFTGSSYQAPASMVSKWTFEVAQAIHFLHTLTPKIIHRDIKPGNVMLDHNHSCKLIDLGLSKTLSHAFIESAQGPKTGGIGEEYMMTGHTGTYGYMAPEVGPEALDPDGMCCYNESCDIFSFGMVVHFMCTGNRPFHWLRCMVAFERLRKGARPSLDALKRRYPDWILVVISKCLLHNPRDRPTSTELLDFVSVNLPKEKKGIAEIFASIPHTLSARRLRRTGLTGSREPSPSAPRSPTLSTTGQKARMRRHSVH